MRLRVAFLFAALAVCVSLGVVVACGSSQYSSPASTPDGGGEAGAFDAMGVTDGGGAGVDADPCAHVLPPPEPATDDDRMGDVGDLVFAIRDVSNSARLGFDASAAPPGVVAQKTLGFDLDDSCTCESDRRGGAAPCTSTPIACDFDGGVDNTFGRLTMGVPAGLGQINVTDTSIANGNGTLLLTVSKYNGKANDQEVVVLVTPALRPDMNPAPGCSGTGATRPVIAMDADGGVLYGPAWDGCDLWGTGQTSTPMLAYVNDYTLVVSTPAQFPVLVGTSVALSSSTVLTALILRDAGGAYSLEDGVMAGRLPSAAIIGALARDQPGPGEQPVCESIQFNEVKQLICGALDTMGSPTQDFGGTACNAMSYASAFRAEAARAGAGVAAGPDPCADAGVDLMCP
jgi:hypothetical protein